MISAAASDDLVKISNELGIHTQVSSFEYNASFKFILQCQSLMDFFSELKISITRILITTHNTCSITACCLNLMTSNLNE